MKFLIVKTSALGDIIHAFPVIQYLKLKFPEGQIDWVVEKSFAGLVEAHPDINRVLCIESKKWRKGPKMHWNEMRAFKQDLQKVEYDAVFDLQGNIKSAVVTMQAKSKTKVGFALKSVPEWPNVLSTKKRFNPPAGQNIRQDYLSLVRQYFKENDPVNIKGVKLNITAEQQEDINQLLAMPELQQTPRLMICPGSAWPNKQLCSTSLKELVERLQSNPCSIIFVWGTPEEKDIAEKLHAMMKDRSHVLDKKPLAVLQNLMASVDCVIAMDSLPLHLAGTTLTPTYSVFGASLAAKYQPLGSHHRSLQGLCPYGRSFEKRCPVLRTCATGACIRQLSGDDVYQDFKKLKVLA